MMTIGMMADESSVIGLTREYRPDWSFSRILCIDFDRPQWVRIAKVALHYNCIRQGIMSRTAAKSMGIKKDIIRLINSLNRDREVRLTAREGSRNTLFLRLLQIHRNVI